MSVRIGDSMSSPRAVHGGSPQGSILGNLLFSITTDGLCENIDTSNENPNEVILPNSPIDDRLARITSENPSCYGFDNITVSADPDELCVPFERNGGNDEECDVLDQFMHEDYHQSTPTQAGQFITFLPLGNLRRGGCGDSPYSSTTGETLDFCKRDRNKMIIDTTSFSEPSSAFTSLSNFEITADGLGARAPRARDGVRQFCYIDDTNGIERLALGEGKKWLAASGNKLSIHAKKSETFFLEVRHRADLLGMKINSSKTQMICISGKRCEEVSSYIELEGDKIHSSSCLKILGFYFGPAPNADLHFKHMKRKFFARYWAIRNLKRSGLTGRDLYGAYCSFVWPILEFACVAFHTLLTKSN